MTKKAAQIIELIPSYTIIHCSQYCLVDSHAWNSSGKSVLNGSAILRSSRPKYLGTVVMKICRKFIGEHPCQSVISVKLLFNFIEIALLHGYYAVNLLHIFKISFSTKIYGRLLQNSRKHSK